MNLTIPFNFNNTEIELSWSDAELLRNFVLSQSGEHFRAYILSKYGKENIENVRSLLDLNTFGRLYKEQLISRMKFFMPAFKNLNATSKIINVGSGVGTLDVLLSVIYNCKCYLVDRSSESMYNKEYRGYFVEEPHEYGFYNSWNILFDCINSSGLDANSFCTLDPLDNWPTDLDLIMSSWSWCWHYPKNIYWDRALQSLKPGGYLMLDIINIDNNTISEISEALKSEPTIRKYFVRESNIRVEELPAGIGDSHGANYIWVNNRK